MKDIYADTLSERMQKSMPGWLMEMFTPASGKPYPLELLSLQREGWRQNSAAYLLDCVRPNETWHPPRFTQIQTGAGRMYVPQLKEAQLYGHAKRKLSEDFLKAVSIATALLPESMRVLSAEQGMRIKLGRILTDIDPAYRTMKCRGQNAMCINTSGIFNWQGQYLAVTQGYISVKSGKYVEDSLESTVDGVLHEFGHNFEKFMFNTLGGNSWMFRAERQQRDFFRAYRQDVADLKGATTTGKGYDLTYYLTKDKGGSQDDEGAACSETLAQLFSEKHADLIILMQKAFPRCTAVMELMLQSMDELVRKNPEYGHISMDIHVAEKKGRNVPTLPVSDIITHREPRS